MVKRKAVSIAARGAKTLFPHLVKQNAKKREYKRVLEKADSAGKNTLKARKALVVRAALIGLKLSPEKRAVALKLGSRLVERVHMVNAWGKNPKKDPVIRELEVDIYDSIGIRTGAKFTSGLKDVYKELIGER